MTKFDNLYSTQDHLREEQQKLLKALLQNQSAKTQKPSGAPAEVAPEIDVKKAKDLKVSFHSDKKCLENNSSGNNDYYYYCLHSSEIRGLYFMKLLFYYSIVNNRNNIIRNLQMYFSQKPQQ